MIKDLIRGIAIPKNDNSEKAVFNNKVFYICPSLFRALFEESPNQYLEVYVEELIINHEHNLTNNHQIKQVHNVSNFQI